MLEPFLKPGDCVKVFAPSGPITTEKEAFLKSVTLIEQHGFSVEYDDSIFNRYHYLAGTTEERIKNVSSILKCEKTNAMWAMRGGVGSLHLLPSLMNITIPPKLLIGFSDITALFPLFWKQHLAVVHAAGMCSLQSWSDEAKQTLFNLLQGQNEIEYPVLSSNRLAVNRSFSGRLLGGNLSVICSLIGVLPNFFTFDDEPILLFIEEVNEPTYKVERMLTQLKLAGVLSNVQALLLGQFTSCERLKDEANSVPEALQRITEDLGMPAFLGIEAGHQSNSQPLLLGPHYAIDSKTLIRI